MLPAGVTMAVPMALQEAARVLSDFLMDVDRKLRIMEAQNVYPCSAPQHFLTLFEVKQL